MITYIDNLKQGLDEIKVLMFNLIDKSRIKSYNNSGYRDVVIVGPDHYWDKPTEDEQRIQIQLKGKYAKWLESFRLLAEDLPDALTRKLERVDKYVDSWIEKKSNWSIPSNLSEAKRTFGEKIQLYYEILSLYSDSNSKETILIPDTNAILTELDPVKYIELAETDRFTLIFLPTVLSELDELKVKSNSQEFRDKVKSVISRLKGYRKQGNLIDGVIVHKTITIRMIATEPDFDRTLSWLDKENNDDRIVASVLEIQRRFPSSEICIVTGDINLQNKAEMAGLTYKDI